MPYSGSCHCGALHYTVVPDPEQVMTCNCSICRRKGAVLHFVDPDQVTLTATPAALGVYRFNAHIIAHHFCKVCGIAVWATVTPPGQAPSVAINLRSSEVNFAALPVHAFDGAAM